MRDQFKGDYFSRFNLTQTDSPQLENAPFAPNGVKGQVRAQITSMLLDAMKQGSIEAVICRAPEFYGPGKTQSITNSTIIDALVAGKVERQKLMYGEKQ